MKLLIPRSWLIPIGSGLLAFTVTLVCLQLLPDEDERAASNARAGQQPLEKARPEIERARGHREFVMSVLQTRRSQPERTPEEWMRFLASLDAWYQTAKVDCVATLTSHSYDAILRLVDEPREKASSAELAAMARETDDSKQRILCYEELWRRASEKGPQACAELLASMSPLNQPRFRDTLVRMWVEARGLQSLAEMAATPSLSARDVEAAFERCAQTIPEACVEYLESEGFQKLQGQMSLPGRDAFLFRVCRHLPPDRAFELLGQLPPTTARNARINTVAFRAVERNPQLAEDMMARDPHLVTYVARAAETIAREKPDSAADIVNRISGERLRTSTARKIALGLPSAKADEFVAALSEPLTQGSVRAAVEKLRKPGSAAGEQKR